MAVHGLVSLKGRLAVHGSVVDCQMDQPMHSQSPNGLKFAQTSDWWRIFPSWSLRWSVQQVQVLVNGFPKLAWKRNITLLICSHTDVTQSIEEGTVKVITKCHYRITKFVKVITNITKCALEKSAPFTMLHTWGITHPLSIPPLSTSHPSDAQVKSIVLIVAEQDARHPSLSLTKCSVQGRANKRSLSCMWNFVCRLFGQ